ncbi:MAG: NBR1-Ig-like domain-containing protein [Anaerolineales bacterium]
MTHKRRLVIFTITLSFTLSACSALATPTLRPAIPGLPATLAAQTMAANDELYHLLCSPTPSPVITTPAPEDEDATPDVTVQMHTVAPTHTPVPMLTPYLAAVLSNSQTTCFNAAEFVKDVSFPDGSPLKPKQKFTKIWAIKNIGTCTWDSDYAAVYVWGDQMKGVSPQPIGESVEPGAIIQIAVDLVAPLNPGSYQGDWMLQDGEAIRFGTGFKSKEHFWVAISVRVPGLPSFPSFCGGGG